MTHESPTPTVGMGVTYAVGSDCYAGTIIALSKSGKQFSFQNDHARRVDSRGLCEDQEYQHTPNPEAAVRTAYLAKDGEWRVMHKGSRLSVGHRRTYRDPSF